MSLREVTPHTRTLVIVSFTALVIACQTVEAGSPQRSIECDEPLAVYCAAQPGGCPASAATADLCAWLFRRGGMREPPQGAGSGCAEKPEISLFDLSEPGTNRSYFFVRGSLSHVTETRGGEPASHCLAGPEQVPAVPCVTFVDFLLGLPCTPDGGTD